jgi:hypothetical protein
MQVLILEDDPSFQAQLAQAMMGKGFNVLCVETVPAAEAFLRLDMADVLIAGERIGGRLSHPVALLAECRNPLVAAVLLTDRSGPELDELFDLMPSLVGVLGRRVAPSVVTQVVMAAVADMASDSVRGRLAARWAAADQPVDSPRIETLPTTQLSAADDLNPAASFAQDDAPLDAIAEGVASHEPQHAAQSAPAQAHGWDRLWQGEIAALVSAASDAPGPASCEAVDMGQGQGKTASARDLRDATIAHGSAGDVPLTVIGRSLRPSPDSPLARVMAAGNRAVSRSLRQTDVKGLVSRNSSLSNWTAASELVHRPLIGAESGAPAMPMPPLPPQAMPLPATTPARRLHLT